MDIISIEHIRRPASDAQISAMQCSLSACATCINARSAYQAMHSKLVGVLTCRRVIKAQGYRRHIRTVICDVPTASVTGRPFTMCGQLLRSLKQLDILWSSIQSLHLMDTSCAWSACLAQVSPPCISLQCKMLLQLNTPADHACRCSAHWLIPQFLFWCCSALLTTADDVADFVANTMVFSPSNVVCTQMLITVLCSVAVKMKLRWKRCGLLHAWDSGHLHGLGLQWRHRLTSLCCF